MPSTTPFDVTWAAVNAVSQQAPPVCWGLDGRGTRTLHPRLEARDPERYPRLPPRKPDMLMVQTFGGTLAARVRMLHEAFIGRDVSA